MFRSRLAIIPQDPFLFSGTVRENIDPAGLRSADEINDAIERCHLRATVDRLGGLDGEITERGRSLSNGERQLVCLARALLSHAQVGYQAAETVAPCTCS
jgi:ATP-binding cassette, subfamily C (CFTR/MRP), member 10